MIKINGDVEGSVVAGRDLNFNVEKSFSKETSKENGKRVFVVHGRNLDIRNDMFQFLRAIGLAPIEWSEAKKISGVPNPYIGQILDNAFKVAGAILVIFTPDDLAMLKSSFHRIEDPVYEKELTPQARPNVIFEAGMALGRCPERTVLLEIGKIRPFSDLSGRYIRRFDGSSVSRHDLCEALREIGLNVDTTGTDWLTVGEFRLEDS